MSTAESQNNRLPRYERAKTPPPMRLQLRDMEILMAVGCEYRYLTSRQIHLLFFGGSMSQTRLRLTKLYHNRYLDRFFRATSKGSGEAVYCLARRGADTLASKLDVDRTQLFWQGKRTALSRSSLEHALRVNDFRIAMKAACERTGLAELGGEWIDEGLLRDLKQRVRVTHPSDPDRHIDCPLVADGFFSLEFENGSCQSFMLEIDMGTESNRRVALKVRGYKEYLNSGKYSEVFGRKSFKVLAVTTSPRRAENLVRTARRAGDRSTFWFTDFSQHTEGRELLPEQLMAPIWQVPGDWFALEEDWSGRRHLQVVKPRDTGRRRSLLELAEATGGTRDG